MKSLIMILLLLFLNNSNYSQWRTIDTKSNALLIDVSFPDSLNGWAIGPRIILHSSDGGETWKQQGHIPDSLQLRRVFFVNNKVGYIVGWNSTIFATKDGGQEWQQQNIDGKFLLQDLAFVNEDVGWIVGLIDEETNGYRGGIILKTTDGGENWNTQIHRNDGIGYDAVKFTDINNGWALGSVGWDNFDDTHLYHTVDGGINWEKVGTIKNGLLFNFDFTNPDTIWAAGFGYSRTFNGGQNWDYSFFIENFPGDTTMWHPLIFYDLLKLDQQKGYAIISRLREGQNYKTKIYITNDGGLYWEFVDTPDEFSPKSMTRVGNNFYVVGADGLAITNKIIVSIDETQNTIDDFSLNQNYPNPFNPTTTIKYFIPKYSYVSLKVYDLLGREIQTLVNEEKPAGEYSVSFNAVNLSSGTYIYALYSNDYLVSKKFILLK